MVQVSPSQKTVNLFELSKWVKNTCGGVIFSVKMYLVDLCIYLKYYSFTGVQVNYLSPKRAKLMPTKVTT